MIVARRLVALALLGLLVLPAHAESELSRLHRVQLAPAQEEVAVRIFGSRAPDFTSFTMQNPFRVVVDWAGSALDGVADRQDFARGVVRRIETQQFESEAERISRVTITLAQPVQFRFETAGKEVRVRFEQVADLPSVPEATPAVSAPMPEPEDEPPPPDDPVLAELKQQPLPEGPLFEPAEPPPAPPPPVVVAVSPPPPAPPAPVPASTPAPAPVPVVASVSPPPAKIAEPAPVAPPPPAQPSLTAVASREVAETRPPEKLASSARIPASSPPVPTPVPVPVTVEATPPAPAATEQAPLARFQPPPAPTPPASTPTPAATKDETTTLARFEPKAPPPTPAVPTPATPAPAAPIAPTPAAPTPPDPAPELARAAPPPAARAAPPPAPRAEPTPAPRAPPAPEVPLLPVVRVEPRRDPAPPARAPEPPRPAFNKRFGDGFEVIQTGRGGRAGQAGGREIQPFEISRAPSRAPASAAPRAATSYSAAAPSFYAQSAGPAAASGGAKEVIDGGDDFEPGPREMRTIGFQQKPDKAAVYVRCDAKAKFRVERQSDTRVVLTLFDTRVPLENNKRPLDTSFFASSVVGVKATEVGADTQVEVNLRGPVPFEVKRIGSYLYLYFNKS